MAGKDYLRENPDGSVTITLARGVTVDGASIKVLQMREPTVGDQIAAQAGKADPARHEVALIANLCSIAPSDVEALTMRDYRRVQAALMGFLD